MDPTTKRDQCLVVLDGAAYRIRPYNPNRDGWLPALCGYSRAYCREHVVLSRMFGIYRYMGWIHGLKNGHSEALRRHYRQRPEQRND